MNNALTKRLKSPVIAAGLSFVVISLLLITIGRFTANDGIADKVPAFLVISLGASLLIAGMVNLSRLDNQGVENLSKKERKQVRQAYYQKKLPSSVYLDQAVGVYAEHQSQLIRPYIVNSLLLFISISVLLAGIELASEPDETLGAHLLDPSNYTYGIIVALQTSILINRIKSYQENPNLAKVRIGEPAHDDDRWWTGKW